MQSAYRWGLISLLITRKVYQSHASTEEETVLLLHEMAFANSANHQPLIFQIPKNTFINKETNYDSFILFQRPYPHTGGC